MTEQEPRRTPEITRTECTRCGTEIHGIDGRYACPHCGWVNHWSEGHAHLPEAHEDADYPGKREACT